MRPNKGKLVCSKRRGGLGSTAIYTPPHSSDVELQ
jgi:hypothetical protein